MRRVIAVLFLAALAGCSSKGMQEEECLTADWRAVGYEDGAQGYGPQYFGVRRKECAEHGVAADFDAYMGGREEGLAHYCRPQNGYRAGVAGYAYEGVCPPEVEAAFMAAHADGFGLYQRRVAMQNIGKRLRYSRQRAQEIEYELVDKGGMMVNPALTVADRTALAIELKNLAQEKAGLERAIPQLENDHAAAQAEYESYRSEMAGRYAS